MPIVKFPNDIEISYKYEKNEGSKETLVFLNGTFNTMNDWEDVGKALLEKQPFNILTFDMRNQGESTQLREAFDYYDFIDDISLLIEHLDLSNITFITYSSSSAMAIDYMLMNYGKVSRLILVAPVINPYGNFKGQLLSKASLKMFEMGDVRDIVTLSFPLMYSNAFIDQCKDFFDAIVQQFESKIDKSLLEPYMRAWDANEMNLSKLKTVMDGIEVHYIQGEEDIFNGNIFTQKLKSEIEQLQVQILPGKGHDF